MEKRLTLVRLAVDLYVDLDINANVVRLVVLDNEHVHSVRAHRRLHIHCRLQANGSKLIIHSAIKKCIEILCRPVIHLACEFVLTILVLQACCAVTTKYGIPSNFVRKLLSHFKSRFQQHNLIFSNRNVIIF